MGPAKQSEIFDQMKTCLNAAFHKIFPLCNKKNEKAMFSLCTYGSFCISLTGINDFSVDNFLL